MTANRSFLPDTQSFASRRRRQRDRTPYPVSLPPCNWLAALARSSSLQLGQIEASAYDNPADTASDRRPDASLDDIESPAAPAVLITKIVLGREAKLSLSYSPALVSEAAGAWVGECYHLNAAGSWQLAGRPMKLRSHPDSQMCGCQRRCFSRHCYTSGVIARLWRRFLGRESADVGESAYLPSKARDRFPYAVAACMRRWRYPRFAGVLLLGGGECDR